MALNIKQFINVAGLVRDLKSFNFRYVSSVRVLDERARSFTNAHEY